MVATGLAFAGANAFPVLLLVAFAGTINPSAGSVSIFVPLEHAALTQAVDAKGRTMAFARYSLVGALAGAAPAGPAAVLPPENVLRGFLLALLAVPAGVLVFTLIWNLGFIASIIGFGVAFLAFFLYRLGSGGRISIKGAAIITAITLGTLVLSFIFANVSDVATVYAQTFGISWVQVMLSADFLPLALGLLFAPENLGSIAGNAGLTLLFGALGCFTVLRGAFQQARAASAPPTVQFPPISPPPPAA
jgi:hypothetical protein